MRKGKKESTIEGLKAFWREGGEKNFIVLYGKEARKTRKCNDTIKCIQFDE